MSEATTTASKALYSELEVLLKEAEAGPRGGAARALRKKWLELTPAELVETSLILGASIGVDFDCACGSCTLPRTSSTRSCRPVATRR